MGRCAATTYVGGTGETVDCTLLAGHPPGHFSSNGYFWNGDLSDTTPDDFVRYEFDETGKPVVSGLRNTT